MCYRIEPSNFLANYFFIHNKNRVNFKILADEKKKIECSVDNGIFIPLNKSAVINSIQFFDDIFSIKNDMVFCKRKKLLERSRDDFNYSLPKNIKEKYVRSF